MKIDYCLISFAFIGASILTLLQCKNCQPFLKYRKSLNGEQLAIYDSVIDERTNLYLYGLVLGIIFAAIYLYLVKGTVNPMAHACVFTAIALTTQYMFYTLAPKSIYMLNVLNSKEQVDNWLDIYKLMKKKYHIGALLGMAGYGLLSYGLLA